MGKSQLVTTFYLNQSQAKRCGANDGFDKLFIITKDEEGKKSRKIIEKPQFIYYMTTEEEYQKDSSKHNYIEKEKVVPRKCYYKDLISNIQQNLNDDNINKQIKQAWDNFRNARANGGKVSITQDLKITHLHNRLHSSDMNIQDFTIDQFIKQFDQKDNFVSISKAFFDIEVDSSEIIGFPDAERAEAPINIISLINEETMECFVLMLKYTHDGYIETVGKFDDIKERLKKKYEKFPICNDMKFEFIEFNQEIDLIKHFFYLINEELRPDFCLAWNISYDFVTIYNRIINLGENPSEIMCPEDFEYKYACYTLDVKHSDPADKSDSYFVLGYTVYYDLMNLYANITKPMGKKESYSLDAIGEEELNIHKDEYEGSIKTLHYDDYETFLFYNIQDTMMLMLIENKTKHVDLLYNISILTHTRIEKALKKTVCLRNFAALFYEEAGYVLSNNRSSLFEKPDGKIKGALTLQSAH